MLEERLEALERAIREIREKLNAPAPKQDKTDAPAQENR